MKLTCLTLVACAGLLCAGTLANAQTSPATSPSDQSGMKSQSSSAQSGTADQSTPGSNSQGNNLDTTSKSPRVDAASAPPTTGQDKAHGNDMVSPNGSVKDGSMKQANASRPEFSTLDTKNRGTLTAADVRNNQWLSKNFSKCDTDHDGTLDRSEYNACH
jgi:hypothetical protein